MNKTYSFYYNPDNLTTSAHLWRGKDTYCKMLSQKKMRRGAKQVLPTVNPGRKICKLCVSELARRG